MKGTNGNWDVFGFGLSDKGSCKSTCKFWLQLSFLAFVICLFKDTGKTFNELSAFFVSGYLFKENTRRSLSAVSCWFKSSISSF